MISFFVLFFLIHFFFNIDIRNVINYDFEEILRFIINFIDKLNKYTFMKYFDISYFWTEFRKEFNMLPKIIEPIKPPKREPLTFCEFYARSFRLEINYHWKKWIEYPIRIRYNDDFIDIAWKTWKAHLPAILGLTSAGFAYYYIFW